VWDLLPYIARVEYGCVWAIKCLQIKIMVNMIDQRAVKVTVSIQGELSWGKDDFALDHSTGFLDPLHPFSNTEGKLAVRGGKKLETSVE
jgi:hypothetical protein